MEQPIIANGGLQIVPQIAVQYVYLDFDGELTSYNGEILTVDNVEVQHSNLTEERIASIIAELNAKYSSQNVIFVSEKPSVSEYSTIYIGKTEAFSTYGKFAGLAETIDSGNKNKTDKAFVMLDSTASDEAIISTISHETDHLLGTLNHGGEGLEAYACHYYYNNTYTGVLRDDLYLFHSSVNYESAYWCSCDSSYYYYDKATNVTIVSGGSLYVESGTTATNITLNGGWLYVSRGAGATDVICSGGAIENGGSMTIGNSAVFTGNTGGAIYNGGGSMTLGDYAVFSGNGAYYGGGAIYNSGGSMTLGDYATFTSNSGGAICNYGSMNIGDSAVFSGNSAYYGGGAIYNSGGSMNIGDSAVFAGNSASSFGGAIYNDGSMTIADSAVFSGNAASNGGAIFNNGGSMTIGDYAVFSGNVAAGVDGGGAIYNSGGSMTIGNSAVFSGNCANSSGGAIENIGGSMTIGDYAVFSGNSAYYYDGGAIHNDCGSSYNSKTESWEFNSGSMTIGDYAVFSGNSANHYGGAIYNGGNSSYNYETESWEYIGGSMTIGDYAVFSGNSAYYGGGAIYNDLGSMTIGNSAVFTGNTGGAINNGGSMTIGNSAVFSGNTGGAICNGDSMTIGDSAVFSGNVANYGGAIDNGGSMNIGDYAVFSGNSAYYYGGGAIDNGGSMTIGDYAVFSGNSAGIGGAIDNGGTMTIGDSAVFTGNTGGAICNYGSMNIGDSAVFSGNVASYGSGGAIYNSGGSMNIGDYAVFAGNAAGGYDGGGAIYNSGGSMTIGDYAVFAGNSGCFDGGAIINTDGSMTIGDYAVFAGNAAGVDCGAICNYGSMNIGDSAVFTGNVANSSGYHGGGAIYNGWHASMTIGMSAVFAGNSAGIGGAIYNWGSMTIGDYAVFAGNTGGAIYNSGGSMTIGDYAVFSGNVASNGGAIYNNAYWTTEYNSATGSYDILVESRGQITLGDVKFATYTDTIYNIGDIILNGDASFAGNITIAEYTSYYGTSVGALQNNGNMDFNISVRVEDDGLLLNDWSRVFGDGTYSITVDDKQVAGEYQLIGNAANFNKTITVRNEDGSKKGELSLDMEEPLELRNMSLLLKLDEETNIVSIIVDSEYSESTDREKQETQIALPEDAFSGMSYNDYTIKQAPDWLTIDPSTGKFSGTTGKITDTATGYGTTEVIITATKGEETKEHTIDVVVVPENIEGDGAIKDSTNANMTDLIADAVSRRDQHSSEPSLLAWMPFPQDKKLDWNYCGLDITLSGAAYGITVTDTDYIISVQGKINLSIFDSQKSEDDRASLQVDLSGEKYIKITTPHDFKSVKFDIAGELTYQNLTLADGFFLKEGVISVDTENDKWAGTADIEFTYFDKALKAEYVVVKKQVDTLTLELSGLDIAVGTTGFFLESVNGGVRNFSDGDDKPSEIVAGVGLYYGKQVSIGGNTYSLATIDADVTITNKNITGSGDIEVLGGLVSGDVSLTVDWKEASLTANGKVTLAKLLTSQGALKIDLNGNVAFATAGVIDFSEYGLGFTMSSNVLLQFSNDNNNTNDYYAAWCTQEFCGTKQSLGVRFTLDGSWELLGTEKVKKINENDNPITYSLRRSRSIPPVTGSWDFSGVSGIVLLSAQWESGETEFLLTDGNGNTYTKEDIAKRSDMEIVESMSNDKTLVIAVKDPVEGIWSLSIANGTNVEIDANILNGKSSVAAPVLTAEARDGRDITVSWNCPELPENAELCIYYDTDSSGNDGVLLAQIVPDENSGTYTWTVPDALAGELRFYAVLSSPDLLPAVGTYTSAIAMEAKEQLVEVDSSGWTYVAGGFYVQDAGITAGGVLEIDGGSLRGDTSVAEDSEIILDEATVSGTLTLAGCMTVKSKIDAADIGIIFDLTNRSLNDDYMINDISLLSGTPTYTITVAADQTYGEYKLAQGAGSFSGNVTIGDGTVEYGTLTVNGNTLTYNEMRYALNLIDGDLTLSVSDGAVPVPELSGNKEEISFVNIPDGTRVVEYSGDDFKTALQVQTTGNAVDTYGMPAGTYQWQVTVDGTAHQGENIISDNTNTPGELASDADGIMDLFFANTNSVWSKDYAAEHQGFDGWTGTGEQVNLEGRNVIADVFIGSDDANVLVLTDDTNGDALFVDDIYTAFGKDAARISQIDEIRAGAGDDIVDMTSQRFAYVGDGVKIYGGLGDDTIWANNGNNTLFGDAGDDRIVGGSGNDVIVGGIGNDSMHGGGGDDIFCFGGNWGNDTVEQLANGKITLWFESGEMGNWDADTLTYTDGTNSVTVRGVAEVSLKFGGNAPVNGAFLDAVSEKIFEEKDKGMLA